MISIVISSYNDSYFNQVSKNIDETIGIPYEIIKVENQGLYSLTKAYNLGAAKARYSLLCFIHEDIKFHTTNWGNLLINHFQSNKDLGLIGVAGSTIKLNIPTGWSHHDKQNNKLNILHKNADGKVQKISTYTNRNIDLVRVIDGVFMVTKKDVWSKNKFNERVGGYHFYDIDFSLNIAQEFKVAVIYDVLIEHFSHGNYGDDWIEAAIRYNELNKKSMLFDSISSVNKLNRAPYYLHLTLFNITLKNKLLYIKSLGIDVFAIPAIVAFIFPKTAHIIKNFLKVRK